MPSPARLVEISLAASPQALAEVVRHQEGTLLLESTLADPIHGRYSLLATEPLGTIESRGALCNIRFGDTATHAFGNPWAVMEEWVNRFELEDASDLPFPLGGCFGYWGYDLKQFLEPRARTRHRPDLDLPDCHLGFYDNLVAFDHVEHRAWIVALGLEPDGSADAVRQRRQVECWRERLAKAAAARGALDADDQRRAASSESASRHRPQPPPSSSARMPRLPDGSPMKAHPLGCGSEAPRPETWRASGRPEPLEDQPALPDRGSSDPQCQSSVRPWFNCGSAASTFTRDEFLRAVERARDWIRQGDIYQVNLSQRFSAPCPESGWTVYRHLAHLAPAPFAAYLNAGDFELISSSPELFLQMRGAAVRTRPIKGTRPRDPDPAVDAQLAVELQTSAKERAELLMITDLLRNDLGRVCAFGSVRVPELQRLERFAHVQHLVSTVEGTLRPGISHMDALRACFPGGSITGAPKLRATQIIDVLEPVARGPYTGALGYLGFNGVSQLSILIRMAVRIGAAIHFHAGAGIVADSQPEAEYSETLAKARGFLEYLNRIPLHAQATHRVRQR